MELGDEYFYELLGAKLGEAGKEGQFGVWSVEQGGFDVRIRFDGRAVRR